MSVAYDHFVSLFLHKVPPQRSTALAATELKDVSMDIPAEEPKNEEPKYEFKAKITDLAPSNPDRLKRELSFRVEYQSEAEETRWSGVFTVLRETIGSFGRFRVIEAQLNDGTVPGANVAIAHNFIAYLTAHLTVVPGWWKPLDMDPADFKVIEDVYTHVARWRGSFRRTSLDGERSVPSGGR